MARVLGLWELLSLAFITNGKIVGLLICQFMLQAKSFYDQLPMHRMLLLFMVLRRRHNAPRLEDNPDHDQDLESETENN